MTNVSAFTVFPDEGIRIDPHDPAGNQLRQIPLEEAHPSIPAAVLPEVRIP
jgi:hypothetical protein